MNAATWTISEVRGRAGLKRLEGDWRRLYDAMADRTVFHTFEAHLAYADHLMDAPERLRCLVLSDGRQVRAIAVLEARLDRSLRIPVPVWGLPFHPHFPLADIVCPEDEARQVFLPAARRYLRRHSGGRSLFAIGPLLETSVLWDGLRDLDGKDYVVDDAGSVHVIDAMESFDDYTARLDSKFRRKMRRARRRLDELPGVLYVSAASPEDVVAEYEAFLDLEASGWKGASGTGSAVKLHPRLIAFYGDLATSMHPASGRCEINSIYADGRCIASHLCMLTGSECASLKIAYDSDFAQFSPGQQLLQRFLERCSVDPAIARVSFVSDADWQRVWHPRAVALRRGYVALDPFAGRLLISLSRMRFGPARRIVRRLRVLRERLSVRLAGEQREGARRFRRHVVPGPDTRAHL